MRSVCVILTDPLKAFIKKGEIKKNYYNPAGFFDKIYYVSFAEIDADSREVKILGGDAEAQMYPLGRMTAFNAIIKFVQLIKLIKKLRPSVIRAYDPSARGLMAGLAGRLLKIPVVISIHAEMDDQRSHDGRLSFKVRILLEAISIRLADAVICVTDYVRAYALRYGARNAVTVYNGVELERFERPVTRDLFKKDTVLCVGRLDKQKYQECIIRAVASLGVDMVFIGDGSERDRLLRLAEEVGGKDRIRFISSVPHGQIQDYYASAKVFAIATHYEGFCIPIIEAMSSGVPIVASRIPPIEEILGDAGLLAENRPEDFRDKIEALLRGGSVRNNMVENGRRRARIFDIQANEEKQVSVYESVLMRNTGGVQL